MLPFLKNNKEASVVTSDEKIRREPDEEKEQEYDYLDSCAEDLIHAVHSKDTKGVAEALRAAFQICDSEPHEEGEHI